MLHKVRLRLLLRGLTKLIVVIVAAGAAGVALGFGLGALGEGDANSDSEGTSTIPRGSVQSTQTTTTNTTTAERQPGTTMVRVQIVSAVLHRAVTASGRRRNRARLSVHVRVTNQTMRTIANLQPVLVAGTRVEADPSATDTAGSLLRPVPQGATAGGTLRFETAGAVTGRLAAGQRAQLRIAGETVTLTVQIGRPARPTKRNR